MGLGPTMCSCQNFVLCRECLTICSLLAVGEGKGLDGGIKIDAGDLGGNITRKILQVILRNLRKI